jgi:hypothetical protein
MPLISIKNINSDIQKVVLDVNGNLTFNNNTDIELSNIVFNKPGTYVIITYTGTLSGFNYLSVTPPSGLTVSEIINASNNKAIKVRLV